MLSLAPLGLQPEDRDMDLCLSDLLSSKLPAQVAALDFNELDFPG
jgi:hypothetical protein